MCENSRALRFELGQTTFKHKKIQGPCAYKKATNLSSIPEALLHIPSSKKSDYQTGGLENRGTDMLQRSNQNLQEEGAVDPGADCLIWSPLEAEKPFLHGVLQTGRMGLWVPCFLILGCSCFVVLKT